MGDIVNAGLDAFGMGPASKQADAVKSAANASANASRYAADVQNQQYQQTRQDQMPWMQAGQTALNALIPLATNYQQFGMDQFQQDPGYAFRLSEGNKALNQNAAARGGLISGNALKAAQAYGQNMGSQEYQNAFNRYQTERNAALNPLQSLAGVGQSSANYLGTAGAANAANIGNIAMTNGANQGNALIAGGNIAASQYGNMGSALNTALNTNWSKVGQQFGFGGSSSQPYAGYNSEVGL